LDSYFPDPDFYGPTIGVNADVPDQALEKKLYQMGDFGKWLNDNRIRVYGWFNAGVEFSSSKNSNYPLTYNEIPNSPDVDQFVLRIERQPDTVQTDHNDWGFRLSNLWGMDYRWTSMEGVFSNQLLSNNALEGYDPVEAYFMLYYPHWGEGTVVQLGRLISPPDIEAQLAPNNFLYTHSVFFDFDCYTQMGILASTKLSNYWTVQYGVTAGNDIAAWDPSAHIPTFEVMGRWVSHSNKDSVMFGLDAINADQEFKTFTTAGNPQTQPPGSQFLFGHDNLQQFNATWTHAFSSNFQTTTEVYYLYERNGFVGGTINNAPGLNFGAGGGPGAFLPGLSSADGFVNYTAWKISPKDFLVYRIDTLNDPRGFRSGFATAYLETTFGWTHRFSDVLWVRPELRFETSLNPEVTPYDNGTKTNQKTLGIDITQFF
jgi:hypothetical protein